MLFSFVSLIGVEEETKTSLLSYKHVPSIKASEFLYLKLFMIHSFPSFFFLKRKFSGFAL